MLLSLYHVVTILAGDREADVAFRFALGAWWVFGFKEEKVYHSWVRFWGFWLRFGVFLIYIYAHCAMSVWLQHPLKIGLLFQNYFFFNSQPRCWFEIKTLLKTGIKY